MPSGMRSFHNHWTARGWYSDASVTTSWRACWPSSSSAASSFFLALRLARSRSTSSSSMFLTPRLDPRHFLPDPSALGCSTSVNEPSDEDSTNSIDWQMEHRRCCVLGGVFGFGVHTNGVLFIGLARGASVAGVLGCVWTGSGAGCASAPFSRGAVSVSFFEGGTGGGGAGGACCVAGGAAAAAFLARNLGSRKSQAA